MLSRHLAIIGSVVLLCVTVLGVSATGCTRAAPDASNTSKQSQLASGTADASSGVPATGSAATTSGGAVIQPEADSAQQRDAKPLSSSDAKAIDAELSAIEKELDSIALPSDSDFGGIESGLE